MSSASPVYELTPKISFMSLRLFRRTSSGVGAGFGCGVCAGLGLAGVCAGVVLGFVVGRVLVGGV